jgi:hypothetical protein
LHKLFYRIFAHIQLKNITLRAGFFFKAVLLLALLITLNSWGFLVHKTVGQLAVYELPKKMRPFFHRNMDTLVKQIIQPDLRRSSDSTEAPRHFIDLEKYGDSAAWKMPLHWTDAVSRYTKDTLNKYGYVPYEVIVEKENLTRAFRNANKDSILFYAADLGHYIGDANVPLHVSVNYDGQLTNQRGLHNLWESTVPEVELNQYNLYSGHEARYLKNPEETIWDAIRNAHMLLTGIFYQEKEVSKNFTDSAKYEVHSRNGRQFKWYSKAFAMSYSKSLGNSVNEQLLKSADLIADFWYTCWVDAGKPDLNHLLSSPFTGQEKKSLKQECKIYRNNQLIEKKLLISRQGQNDYNF